MNPRSYLLMAGLFLTTGIVSGCAAFSSQDKTTSNAAISGTRACGDLLIQMGTNPPELEFESCAAGSGQVIQSARYKVLGAQAAMVEEFLHREYGMGKLKFVCCGWEPAGALGAANIQGRSFAITMNSEETLVSDPAEWRKIPFFYVTVEELDL